MPGQGPEGLTAAHTVQNLQLTKHCRDTPVYKDENAMKMVGINLLSRYKTNTASPPFLLFNTSDPLTTPSHS